MQGTKDDKEKLMWDLLPLDATEKIVEVLTFGAKKYSPHGWKTVPDSEERYYAALLRHLVAYKKGEQIDNDSGLSHLSHAACNALFLLHFEIAKEREN